MNKKQMFDISLTYAKGDIAICGLDTFLFDPHEKQSQFSTGKYPSYCNGWSPIHRKTTYEDYINTSGFVCSYIDYDPSIPGDDLVLFYINSEPNEPNVLECKDKMINEI